MERWVAKMLSTIIIFVTMSIAGLLPIKVSQWYQDRGARGELYISVLNCFGGGVFFGTYLMHMAPEVRHILTEHLMDPHDIHYPLPELTTAFGFFMLLFVDRFVTLAGRVCQGNVCSNKGAQSTVESNGIGNGAVGNENNNKTGNAGGKKKSLVRKVSQRIHITPHEYDSKDYDPHTIHDPAKSPPILRHIINTDTPQNNISRKNSSIRRHSSRRSTGIATAYDNPTAASLEMGATNPATNCNYATPATKEIAIDGQKFEVADSAESSEIADENTDLATRPYIFLIALSIDCIFEGMSLGLQDTGFGAWMMMVAILSHELVITFSFGLRACRLFSQKKTAGIILFYTSTIPIGVGIGFGVYESGLRGHTVEIVSGVFQAIAAGIFIYITFVEILSEELSSVRSFSMSRPIAVLVGFVFMALMVLMHSIEHAEDESHDEHVVTNVNNITSGLAGNVSVLINGRNGSTSSNIEFDNIV